MLNVTTAATYSTTALLAAAAAGWDPAPLGEAGVIVDLARGRDAIAWSTATGTIDRYTVIGWPSTGPALGGAFVLERPDGGLVGIVDIGESPASIELDVSA